MWKKNRKRREKRIKKQQKEKHRIFKEVKSLSKENQSDFVEQIKCQSESYRFLNSQKHNNIIEEERQLQLQYHKQINKYA